MRQGRVWGGGRSDHSNGIVNFKIGHRFTFASLREYMKSLSRWEAGRIQIWATDSPSDSKMLSFEQCQNIF